MVPLSWVWWGRVSYIDGLMRQHGYRSTVQSGIMPSQLFLLEHDPVITLGRRGGEVRALPPGTPRVRVIGTERGGLATAHEAGQLVGYLVADIRKPGVRRVVGALEEGMIGWLRDQGLPAERKEGFPGAWCGGAKVAAIGLHVQRGVSIHGFSLNLVNDLKTFAAIVPCGIEDGEVTTVERLGGPAISPEAAAPGVAKRVLDALGALI